MNKAILIENYFTNTLSPSEKEELERLLNTDADFQKEFQFQETLREAIKNKERQKLKQHLKSLETAPKTIPLRRWYTMAAALIVLFGLGWALLYSSGPNYEQLYAAQFEPYPNVIVPAVRSDTQVVSKEVATAFRYYDSHNYTQAATAFQDLYKANQEDYAMFYYAVSLMAGNETQKAIAVFETHSWNTPQNYETISNWYLGLGYVKLENKEKAVGYLNAVANSDKPLAKQAKEVLQNLEK